MRTTVRLDDELLRAAKTRAAETGRTLTAILEEALRAYLARADSTPREGLELPVSAAVGGTLPGVDLDDTAALYDVMDGAG